MKRLIRDETGQTLIMALVLLLVGGLIIAAVLSYMGTGLASGGVYEKKAAELYAADAGVEDAVWKIQHPDQAGYLPCSPGSPPKNYNIPDVNGKSVDITITCYLDDETGRNYGVESIATGDGSGTKIEAYITGTSVYGNYSGITDHVITSQGEITLQPGTEVNPSEGEHAPIEYYSGDWPTADELADWYWYEVKDETPYPSGTIDINGVNQEIGPLYRAGTMDIKNSSNTPATLTLTGTVYITGDTKIGTTGKDFTLDMNGNTIFIASDSADPQKALEIGGKCSIVGPGAIIAIGDIYFQPNIPAGMTDPIFIMSVSGETLLQPGGDFYGSVAGSVEVQLQPGTSLNYPEDGFGVIDFPGCTAGRFAYSIASWEVGHS